MVREERALMAQIDEASDAEIDARALRDHYDRKGDEHIKEIRQALEIMGRTHPILKRLFPKGVAHETRPRGPEQLIRHDDLIQRFMQSADSGELDKLKKAEKIKAVFAESIATMQADTDALRPLMKAWQVSVITRDNVKHDKRVNRDDILDRLNAMLPKIAIAIGGTLQDVHEFTR